MTHENFIVKKEKLPGMKILLLLFILFFAFSLSSKSQNYRYSISVSGGIAQSYADVKNSFNPQQLFHANADYLLKDFISVGVEFQSGKLINGIAPIPGEHYPYFENDFRELNVNGKVSLGQFVDVKNHEFLRKIRGLYAGAGLGLITTNQKNSTRTVDSLKGSNNERMVSVPLNFGIDFYLRRKSLRPLAIGLNTQLNIIPNDRLDGYDQHFNKLTDFYAFTSLSLKYRFGNRNILNRNIFPH